MPGQSTGTHERAARVSRIVHQAEGRATRPRDTAVLEGARGAMDAASHRAAFLQAETV